MRRDIVYPRSEVDETITDEVRAMRRSPDAKTRLYLSHPETLVYHFIEQTHGNVKLHLSTVACELGVTMRTLERNFYRRFAMSMAEHQALVRLRFACFLLQENAKCSASEIAACIGYDDVRHFRRFFRNRMHETPRSWSARHRLTLGRPISAIAPDLSSCSFVAS